jgi:hypothetical protein
LFLGAIADYDASHPTSALLMVEVADRSLPQDRLTKSAIYATANIPGYWLVTLRDDCVEVFRSPDPTRARYPDTRVVLRGERINPVAFPQCQHRSQRSHTWFLNPHSAWRGDRETRGVLQPLWIAVDHTVQLRFADQPDGMQL